MKRKHHQNTEWLYKDIDVFFELKLDEGEKEVYLVPELNNPPDLFLKVIGSDYEPMISYDYLSSRYYNRDEVKTEDGKIHNQNPEFS